MNESININYDGFNELKNEISRISFFAIESVSLFPDKISEDVMDVEISIFNENCREYLDSLVDEFENNIPREIINETKKIWEGKMKKVVNSYIYKLIC